MIEKKMTWGELQYWISNYKFYHGEAAMRKYLWLNAPVMNFDETAWDLYHSMKIGN